ncbi:LacI family transcriptional regulator [Halobacillus andaensis]|uniref:LacI family transcriptional regulator n=1 Tax=Halobacillus andaensis TaxID=1176239 RepID=A0A917BDF0_HALAA|nr:LacI family DNA-binding transcriptional regulator [Halobacillus andaensis]MBP2006726.1 LacI family transcriptional regulator [Halobacillus andaensis]GGF36185.1 LacI family transcriptional regulator [Halobacillus andaensis]
MTTIYDIAKKTGFSITTVSRALNNYTDVSKTTKKIILDAVTEMGYYPNSSARSLTTKKSWTLGVIFVEDLGIGMKHPFFSAVIESFKQNAEAQGYDIIFLSRNVGGEEKSYLDHASHRGVDGIIIMCSDHKDKEVQQLIESPFPTVVVDLHSDQSSVVYSDNFRGSMLAVDHLVELGHRNIAHIKGHDTTYAGLERLRGFRAAMEKHSLSIPSSYIVDGGFFSVDGGYLAMKELLQLNEHRPTAVFVAGDNMALGALKACKESGITVPDDLSIVGFDDIEVGQHITPTLTTIHQDTDLIGKKASEVLIQQINTRSNEYAAVTIPVKLIVRESTKAIS